MSLLSLVDIKTIFLGLGSGVLGGITGSSGTGVITAGLLMLGIVDNMKTAAGTTLATILLPLSLAAVITYYQRKQVNFRAALILIFTMFFATWYGSYLTKYVTNQFIQYLTAVYFLCVTIFFFYNGYYGTFGNDHDK
jgi:hypothetical protein